MNSRSITVVLTLGIIAFPSPPTAAQGGSQPLTPPTETPRRVICVSAGNDAFLSGAEGYYRSLPRKSDPDVVMVGGNLADCLAQVRKGDQLIVVAHGARGTFLWDNAKGGAPPVQHGGYGAGTGVAGNPYPVPPNLRGTNHVTVTLVGCCSAADPPGAPISVTQSLLDAMNAGGGANNTCTGFARDVNADIDYGVGNATTQAQLDAALANLRNNPAWSNNPPVNRNPPAATNQQTAAQAQLDAKFPHKALTVTVQYGEPMVKAAQSPGIESAAGLDPCDTAPDSCGGAVLTGFALPPRLPGLPGGGALALGSGLLLMAMLLLMADRRRQELN